jgi:Tol biopolymer transport system component
VQLKIVNVTDGGNNLYIDNIYVGDGSIATTNVSEISDMSGSVFLYPNPSMDNSTLAFVLDRQGIVKIEIYSMQGQLVKSINESAMSRGNQRVTISTSGFKQGVYFVRLTLGVIEKTIPMVIITPQ